MRTRTLLLALLCLVVVAFAAATLDRTTTQESGVGLGSNNPQDDLGSENTPTTPAENVGSNDSRFSFFDIELGQGAPLSICIGWLQQPLVQLGLVAALVGVFLAARRLRSTSVGLALVFVIGYPGVFIYLILTSCRSFGLPDIGNPGKATEQGGGLFGGGTTVPSPSLPSQLLLIAVVVTLVVVAAVVLTSDHDLRREDEEADDDDEDTAEESADVAAIGRSAGRAADRLEYGGEFENEIYRAWAEMTEHLAVDSPVSSTPTEFATTAVEAGMDSGDVDRLTTLFEEVRYGDAAATEEREAAAVETLRRIESAYAGDDS